MKKLIRNFSKSLYYLNALVEITLISVLFVVSLQGIFASDIRPIDDHATIVPIVIFSALFLYITGSYSVPSKRSIEIILTGSLAILFSDISAVLIMLVYSFIWFGIWDFVLTVLLQIAAFSAWIVVSRAIYKSFKKPQKVVVVCYDIENIDSYIKKIQGYPDKYEITKIVSYDDANLYYSICQSEGVFMLDLSSKKREKVAQYCLALNKNIYILPELYEISVQHCRLEQVDDIPFFFCKPMTLTLEEKFIKRVFDVLASAVAIILSSPIMLVVAILIKRDDGGPIFYTQQRITENYRPFNVIKFRTMVPNAEEISGATLSTKEDPRITKIGKKLRALRLDELPQLFNIFIGDMSFVGPRPERDVFIQEYVKEVPEFVYRLNVKAGLTGLAQVRGKYNTTPQDKLKMDLLYINDFSFLNDIKICFLTVKVIFTKESTEGIDGEVKNKEVFEKSAEINDQKHM
ncbi:MAG: sugar transferase [Oscillospiraceae bacterium]|nr:sugar transferase [Oscillospiraceae bacterium]